MAKLETQLHCGHCENGIVTLVVSKVKRNGGIDLSASVNKCTLCKTYYGLKEIQNLKQANVVNASTT
jgi:hypothetical protein